MGIHDEELVDEVGISLLARIEDCLTVTEAHGGSVKCPDCGKQVVRRAGFRDRRADQETLQCQHCGWELPWPEYHRSYRKKNMGSAGLMAFFREFAEEYPTAKTYQEKMILIDTLLHRYHWELEGEPGGPAAVNLTGGTRSEVLAFLNRLTYADQSTPGLESTRQDWLKKLNCAGWNRATVDELTEQYRQKDEQEDG